MEIKRVSEEMGKYDSYKLTRSKGSTSIKECAGSTIEWDKWVLYEDADNDGTMHEVLAVMAKDGEVFVTTSPTFIRDFMDIYDHFEGEKVPVKVIQATSKNNREYLACDIV